MNKIIFCRLGVAPDMQVSKALSESIIANTTSAKILPLPGVIISVFESELSPEQIRAFFQADEYLQKVPFMVFTAENFDINFPEEIRQRVFELGVATPQREEKPLTLDDLLEIISQKGIGALTPAQRARLDELSQ